MRTHEGTNGASPGVMIAGRYRLLRSIGAGTHGEVWEASDTVTARRMAIKLLRPDTELALARVQLEVAALRQRLPGVVELFDDGVDGEQPYLVMELVDGTPFPGRSSPCSWADIADLTVSLLETLGRVHAASVIHRDLKPENVLVTAERQIRILDFGLAYRANPASTERLTGRGEVLGTPAYIAPEQLRGVSVSERSDLYAVGVMLYTALAGQLPHQGSTIGELFFSRLNRRPTPIDQIVPMVPTAVARVVDRLLAILPEERPRSAFEVLALLRGQPAIDTPHFPWLGPQEPLLKLVNAARRSRSIDVVGPSGSGKTRCLLAVEQAMDRERRIIWIQPSDRAFASLSPIVGTLAEYASQSLTEVSTAVEACLRSTLSEGAILLVDDAEQIDRMSAEALARCRNAGAIVRAFSDHKLITSPPAVGGEDLVRLTPLCEVDLRSLFAGPDRLLHLREDAARVLLQRTDGLPARICHEVTTWVRLNIARWLRNLLVVQRDALERLESGLFVAAPIQAESTLLAALPAPLADTLTWMALAWPHTRVELISQVMGEARFRVEHAVNELISRGLARELPDGRIEPRGAGAAIERWTYDRLQRAHQAIALALAPGDRGRLLHLLLAGAESDAARLAVGHEATVTAERLIDEGRLGHAIAAIESGLRSLRGMDAPPAESVERLLGLYMETAVAEGTPHALDRAIYAICRTEQQTEVVRQLEMLGRAALGLEDWTGRPSERVESVRPFADRRMERVRLAVRVAAARHLPDRSVEEAILQEMTDTPLAADPEFRASLDTWWGRLRYRQGRFREAAGLHASAARHTSAVLVKAYSKVSGALALMEAFAFQEARALAEEASALASLHRHAYYEMFAAWILRALAYRTDCADHPDIDLIAAVPYVGGKELEGVIYLNEAAVAWRAGKLDAAGKLADKAYQALSAIGQRSGPLLARCLLIALRAPVHEEEIDSICARAKGDLLPGLGVQALGLLALGGRLPRGAVNPSALQTLTAPVPRGAWTLRMDILSVEESIDAIAAAKQHEG